MPRRSDSAILTYASRSYVQECILAGVKIYFYDGGMLHSKVVVVDDDFSSVGSANIDFRSFEHNFEANMMIYSPSVNSRLRRRFEDDQACSERVRGAEWRRRLGDAQGSGVNSEAYEPGAVRGATNRNSRSDRKERVRREERE